jgi:hypothetical protein
MQLVLNKITPCGFEIIFEHKALFMIADLLISDFHPPVQSAGISTLSHLICGLTLLSLCTDRFIFIFLYSHTSGLSSFSTQHFINLL